MSSSVDALVITCTDSRLHRAEHPYVWDFLRGKYVGIKTWDLVAVPGGCRGLTAPEQASLKDTLLQSIKISREAHAVKQVILINHSDCQIYGGARAFASAADEYRKQAEDLRAARQFLRDTSPNLDVRLFYATVEDRTAGPFVTLDEVR